LLIVPEAGLTRLLLELLYFLFQRWDVKDASGRG
jgi:hypothetical protein